MDKAPPHGPLTDAHRALIRLLAEVTVDAYLAELARGSEPVPEITQAGTAEGRE